VISGVMMTIFLIVTALASSGNKVKLVFIIYIVFIFSLLTDPFLYMMTLL